MQEVAVLLFATVLSGNLSLAQESEPAVAAVAAPIAGVGIPYTVQLTEFRVQKEDAQELSADEIIEALEEARDDISITETIRLSVLPSYEGMVQIGRTKAVSMGATFATGRQQARQMAQRITGTIVRVTAEPSDGKILLKLSYEASRFDGDGGEDSPPDETNFHVNTTLLLEPGKSTLAGGSSADASSFLAVSVK